MATHPIRFGIQTGQQNVSWHDLAAVWKSADAWGYDSLWNFDHFYPIFTDPSGPCMECWTTLGGLAQVTSKATVGQLVSGNTYRHPSVTAKAAATLDQMSDGRARLGIGAGWFEREHTDLGFDFKTVRGRLDALEESLQIIKGAFSEDTFTLDGKHYQVSNAIGNPKPIQSGGVPILIGGSGEKILLRLVAQYADMWNNFADPERMKHLVDVIARHGDKVGRDTSEIEKTVMMPLCYTEDSDRQNMIAGMFGAMNEKSPDEARKSIMIGGKQECRDKIAAYQEAGVTHFIFMTFAPYMVDEMQAFAEEVAPVARGN